MKHKKMQKKVSSDVEDMGDTAEETECVSLHSNLTSGESRACETPTSSKFSGYDVNSLVKSRTSFSSETSEYPCDSDNEEIDVVESDEEK